MENRMDSVEVKVHEMEKKLGTEIGRLKEDFLRLKRNKYDFKKFKKTEQKFYNTGEILYNMLKYKIKRRLEKIRLENMIKNIVEIYCEASRLF